MGKNGLCLAIAFALLSGSWSSRAVAGGSEVLRVLGTVLSIGDAVDKASSSNQSGKNPTNKPLETRGEMQGYASATTLPKDWMDCSVSSHSISSNGTAVINGVETRVSPVVTAKDASGRFVVSGAIPQSFKGACKVDQGGVLVALRMKN